jgi:2-polyprenyl-3-methyl-5-hydroxy-6-metoxy-1,4-benzoquinol methylase
LRGPRSALELDVSARLRTDAVLALFSPAAVAGGKAADLGCATGYFSARLAALGLSVVCVDVSAENLTALEHRYPDLIAGAALVPVQASVTDLPIESESVGAVFCMEVIEHVEDDRRAISEMHRVLVPGGLCVLTTPNRKAPQPLVERLGLQSVHDVPGPERHVRPGYSRAELQALLAGAGFEVTRLGGVGGTLYRLTSGLVSLLHLAYRRARGQRSWTWADVELELGSPLLRLYALLFPVLLAVARLDRALPGEKSSLLATAVRRRV